MKRIISLLMSVILALSSMLALTSCGFDDTAIKAELVGTWIRKDDPMYLDSGLMYTYEACYVFYQNGEYYHVYASQFYNSSGAAIGEPDIFEEIGTYKIKEDCIETRENNGSVSDFPYHWNATSGKITSLASGFRKVSNSTNYFDNLLGK